MKKYPLIYLSSTSYHWWNFVSKNWKKNIIKEFKISKFKNVNYIDPLVYKSEDPKVCPLDIRDILKSDYIIVYLDKITIGTMLELGFCLFKKNINKKFYVLSFNKNVVNHPWIQYLCKYNIATSYKECVDRIYLDWTERYVYTKTKK